MALTDYEDSSLSTSNDLVAAENRARFERSLQTNPWGLSPKALEAKAAARAMLSTKTGLHARIPITCKGETCPYAESCALLPYDMAPTGEYCPIEIAQVEALANGYASDFELDEMSFTDKMLINEIVAIDIMIERCKGLMAKAGTPVIDVTIAITEQGEEVRQPAIDKALEAYEKLTKRKDQKLQLLHLTRTDKIRHKPEQDNQDSWLRRISETITIDDLQESAAAISSGE